METHTGDELDRQLIHALAIAPRAPFTVLAAVMGVSDQTVARRYRRLVATAGLRVSGLVNAARLGWVDWFVRLQVTPGSADQLARALAERPDTRWVNLTSGGTEVTCILQARTAGERNDLFLRGLPGSRRVTQMTAHSMLRVFSGVEWAGVSSTLSGGQLAELRAAAGVAYDTGPRFPVRRDLVELRPDDDALLAELARDGRASHAALAAAIHWHESAVRRRVEDLQEQEVLYFDVDIDEGFNGPITAAMLWISVEPACLEYAGRAIVTHPEVPFAAATTGPTNLAASVVFRDTRHMYEYLTGRLTELPGLRTVESAPVIGRVKQASTVAPRLSG